MLRFLARLVGAVLLAVAVVFAVGDVARSLASETMVLQPAADALTSLGLAPAASSQGGDGFGEVIAAAWALIGPWPVSILFLVLAFLFLALGSVGRAPQSRLVR
ncbi:hypothetical protein [Consotaella aegiceratis]|uniref:hypothetical protein n=1 Tax=Consotaella aegiceratis TaxID=3097961 RepID=UPI002F42FAEB